MKKDKRENNAKQLIIWGTVFMVAAPFIFMAVYGIRLSDSAEIGETIGGITSPFVGFVGALLLYFALSAQIDSNKLLATEIEEDKARLQKQKDEDHISQLYNFFIQNIADFTFEVAPNEISKNATLTVYKGGIALDYFVDFLQNDGVDAHSEDEILKNRDTREFVSIIKSGELLIDALKASVLDEEDKRYYKSLIVHQLTYKISPNFDGISKYGKKMEMCSCGLAHGKFPAFILKLLINTKEKLESV